MVPLVEKVLRSTHHAATNNIRLGGLDRCDRGWSEDHYPSGAPVAVALSAVAAASRLAFRPACVPHRRLLRRSPSSPSAPPPLATPLAPPPSPPPPMPPGTIGVDAGIPCGRTDGRTNGRSDGRWHPRRRSVRNGTDGTAYALPHSPTCPSEPKLLAFEP